MTAHLWQSTLFALAAALLTLAFRGNGAQVRFCLWLSASLKFLFPFALLAGMGAKIGWPAVSHAISTERVAFVIARISGPFAPLGPPQRAGVGWKAIVLAACWACGFLCVAAMRLRGWLSIRAAMRASVLIGIPSRYEVRAAPGLLEPGVVGLLRPAVLLPQGIVERLTPLQLEAVLAHEICHIRRRDNLIAAIHMIVEAMFWFHPLVWWIGARLIEERERACDEAVVTLGNQPRIYADAIVEVCRLYIESPLACVSGVTGADLNRRIEAIMTNRTTKKLNRAKKFLLAAAGTMAIAIPVATGVLLSVGHLQSVHAQLPAAAPASPAQRMTAMLFDFGSMTPDQQSGARQYALDFVSRSLKPNDTVAVLSGEAGKVTIAQDFTSDPVVLTAAILRLPVGAAGFPAAIESAAQLLTPVSGKKALMYFGAGLQRPDGPAPLGIQSAIGAAMKAQMAIYPIDINALRRP